MQDINNGPERRLPQPTTARSRSRCVFWLTAVGVVFFAVETELKLSLAQEGTSPKDPIIVEQTATYRKEEVRHRLIPGFPDVPVYPGAKLVNSYKKMEGNRVGFQAISVVDDASVPQVMAFLIERLVNQKWQITRQTDSASQHEQGLRAQKGSIVLHIVVEREDGKTEIAMEIPMYVEDKK